MVSDVFTLMEYYFSTLVLILIFGLIGDTLISLARIQRAQDQTFNYLISPIIGLSVLSLIVLGIIRFGDGLPQYSLWGLVVTAGAWRLSKSNKCDFLAAKKLIKYPILSALIGQATYLPFFMRKSNSPLSITGATWQNNDLGAYIQMATNIVRSGFNENGLIDNYPFGLQASFDHPAAQGVFAMVSQLLNRKPYEIGIIAMSSVVGSLALGCMAAISKMWRDNSTIIAIGFVCVFNPVFALMILYYFFGQILAISFMFGVFLVFFLEDEFHWRMSLLASCVTLSAFLTSPEVAIALFPILAFVGMISNSTSIKIFLESAVRLTISLLITYGVAILIYGESFSKQFSVLSRATQGGIAGWSLDLTSSSGFFGLLGSQIGGPYSSIVRFFDLAIIFGLICCVICFFHKNKITVGLTVLLASAGLVQVLAYSIWGLDTYQSWKTLATFSFFIFFAIFAIFGSSGSQRSATTVVFVAIFIVGSTYNYVGHAWKDATAKHIEHDLVEIISSNEFERQTAINLLLGDPFETMSASAIPGIPVRMSSSSYQYGGGQSLKYLCTLTKKNLLESFEHGDVIFEKGEYLIVGTPKCK